MYTLSLRITDHGPPQWVIIVLKLCSIMYKLFTALSSVLDM